MSSGAYVVLLLRHRLQRHAGAVRPVVAPVDVLVSTEPHPHPETHASRVLMSAAGPHAARALATYALPAFELALGQVGPRAVRSGVEDELAADLVRLAIGPELRTVVR